MTVRQLAEVREHFCIPTKYELYVPLPGHCLYDALPDDFGLSIDALKAELRFPVHPVIEACLDGWQISPSHMAPNSWRYLVAFLGDVMGRILEIVCIPDPNGEYEEGQASSLAVSTRWISAAKLLQSDLVTLAQRVGGEYEVWL
ncbi:hypothetical protein BHE74_00042826, partial [Ensete ventricosum]